MQSKEIQKKIEDDLREYINNPNCAKPYSQSMNDLEKYLNELKK
jgi:hypothetical protein